MLRGSVAWVCRGSLFAVLLAAGASGAQAAAAPPNDCGVKSCSRAGTIRWTRPLPGNYLIDNDSRGVVPAAGQSYAAIGGELAVFGLGVAVRAYDSARGTPRWTVRLKGLPPGARIASVRVWPGVITVGVTVPVSAGSGRATETEVVLDALDGRLIRSYPGTLFGGAVAADSWHAVIVGPGAVTSYDNVTGAVVWRQATGAAPQRWQLDGYDLYVAVSAGGYLGTSPVTALRKIDLRSGAERIIAAPAGSFAGVLSAALDAVVLFSGSGTVTAYSGNTGRWRWRVAGAFPQAVDLGQHRFYLTQGNAVVGVNPSGVVDARLRGSAGLYGERDGVAFGLDEGASGDAWGADTVSQHVIWSTSKFGWPHVFVDFSGLGGSADPRRRAIILAVCAQTTPNVSPPRCAKPELMVINR